MREYIIYGLFEKVPVYNFSYNTNYNTLNDNGSVNESGTNSGINMNKVPVTKELLDDFVSGSQINAQDNDSDSWGHK